MDAKELSTQEKKACIVFMIATLISRTEEFICHCFSEFVKSKTDMVTSNLHSAEDHMHIIFPELYNALESLVKDDLEMLKYNANVTRMGDYFEETHKCPIWYHQECDERVHFLNDLNETL